MDKLAYISPVHSEFLPKDFRQSRDLINSHLQTITREVTSEVNTPQLQALILGGGYARGEGGIRYEDDKLYPYNDYDLFAFFNSPAAVRNNRRIVTETAKKLSIQLGIDVDIYCTTLPGSRSAHTMMWIELYYGHIVLFGANDFMQRHFSHLQYDSPDKTDVLRLLMNRGAGLVLAKLQLMNAKADADFIIRNCHKATLAIGDSLLILNNLYSPYTLRRQAKLTDITHSGFNENELAELIKRYKDSVSFKLTPQALINTCNQNLPQTIEDCCALFHKNLDFFLESDLKRTLGNASLYYLFRSLYYQLLNPQNAPKTKILGDIYKSLLTDMLDLLNGKASQKSLESFIEVWQKHS